MDITITSCIRPSILKRTLTSFCTKMFHNPKDYRVIINIDPIGDFNHSQMDVYRVVESFKFREVVANMPKTPSYAAAVIWCWERVTSDFFFHLEDDWLLLRTVNIRDLISAMGSNMNIAQLRFSKYSTLKEYSTKVHSPTMIFDEKKPRLCPGLTRKSFMRMVLPHMDVTSNPEKQFDEYHPNLHAICQYWQFANYKLLDSTNTKLIQDIGRNWMTKNHFAKICKKSKKKKKTDSFTTWEKTK